MAARTFTAADLAELPEPTPLPSLPKRLVVCADDYGMNASVSEAVLRLVGDANRTADSVRLGATSVMVLSPRWPEDAKALAEHRGQLDVGLHLDWTSRFARDAGHGMGLAAAMGRALLGGFNRQRARRVIEEQLDAFEAAWGAPPDHVDGHQHVQQFSGIRESLLEVLSRRYVGHVPWLRVSRSADRYPDLKSRIIGWVGARELARAAQRESLPTSATLSGIYGFEADEGVYCGHMRRWLTEAPDGAVLMCHPSTLSEKDDEIGPARVREYEFLSSEGFASMLQACGVRVVRGSVLYAHKCGAVSLAGMPTSG